MAVTQIVAYVDQGGHCLYVSADDRELRAAVTRGGVAAGLHLVNQRRQSLLGVQELIETVSYDYGVDPELVRAVIDVESAWNPNARSHKGALGLMQLLPQTGARFGVQRFFEPGENVTGGIRYLRFLLDHFAGDLELTLAAYNAGEDAVDSHGGIPPYLETQSYVKQVEARYRQLTASENGTRAIHMVQDDGRVLFANY
jgi:soluble lytic murein transglycosylase-like protein